MEWFNFLCISIWCHEYIYIQFIDQLSTYLICTDDNSSVREKVSYAMLYFVIELDYRDNVREFIILYSRVLGKWTGKCSFSKS